MFSSVRKSERRYTHPAPTEKELQGVIDVVEIASKFGLQNKARIPKGRELVAQLVARREVSKNNKRGNSTIKVEIVPKIKLESLRSGSPVESPITEASEDSLIHRIDSILQEKMATERKFRTKVVGFDSSVFDEPVSPVMMQESEDQLRLVIPFLIFPIDFSSTFIRHIPL